MLAGIRRWSALRAVLESGSRRIRHELRLNYACTLCLAFIRSRLTLNIDKPEGMNYYQVLWYSEYWFYFNFHEFQRCRARNRINSTEGCKFWERILRGFSGPFHFDYKVILIYMKFEIQLCISRRLRKIQRFSEKPGMTEVRTSSRQMFLVCNP